MSKFEAYINEGDSGRHTPLGTDEEVTKVIQANCGGAAELWLKGQKIYRGSNSHWDVSVGDPYGAKEPRRSANTSNHYTLWMDNSKQWKGFPKRSRSFVCTTLLDTAIGYGHQTYFVIPFDDAPIGVCSKTDLWWSFPRIKEVYSAGQGPQDLNSILKTIFDNQNAPKADTNWNTLKKAISKIDDIIEGYGWDTIFEDVYYNITTSFKDNAKKHKNLTSLLTYMFDPKGNKFYATKGNKRFKSNDGQEVWIGGKAVFISFNRQNELTIEEFLRDAIS